MDVNHRKLGSQTMIRWGVVGLLFLSGLVVFASSVYFLLVPAGYQGGRNPYYGLTVLFDRETWHQLHLWSGVAMIILLVVHILIHWKWIQAMFERCFRRDECTIGRLNWRARFNVTLNVVAALCFLVCATSGIYFLFAPPKRVAVLSPGLISYQGWTVLHTWSGVIMILLAVVHVALHWKWVTRVTARMFANRFIYEPRF